MSEQRCWCWCACGHSKYSHDGPYFGEGPYGDTTEEYGACFHACDDCEDFTPIEGDPDECDYCSPHPHEVQQAGSSSPPAAD